jgi:hypothetical protein
MTAIMAVSADQITKEITLDATIDQAPHLGIIT